MVAIGFLVLVGWVFDVSFLKGPLPGLVQMKAGTAVGFLALGSSLLVTILWDSSGGRRAARGLAGLAILIGVVTLAEYVLGRNLGIDQLLFRDSSVVQTVHPGRLAPQAAIDFTLLGLALVFLNAGRPRRTLVEVFTALSFLLALFAVIGYAYGVTSLDGLPSLTPIALYTAVTLLVLCAGIATADPEGVVTEIVDGAGPGSLVARRLLPISLVGGPILGWVGLKGQDLGLFGTTTGVALLIVVSTVVLGLAIMSLTRRLNGLDARRRRAAVRETRLADLVDASSEAIASMDRDGLILTWNRAAEEYFGYTADEILGQTVAILSPPDRAEEQRQLIQTVVRDGRSTRLDTQWVHKNGQRLDVSVTASRLMTDGELTGFCAVFHDIGERVRAHESLSRQLSVRTRELDDARLEAFNKLTLAAEYRDDETRDHTRRVGEMSAALATHSGIDPGMVEIIRQVAPLHDLGKIGISDLILLKPGKLTDSEYALMKNHARIGAEILAGSNSPLFLIAAEIAGLHHERWDGSGYPDRLAGHEIPVAARIVGLVDVFDALTHERPYKAAWSIEDALTEIAHCSGTHFDPELVSAFLQLDHATLLEQPEHAGRSGLSDSTWDSLNRRRPAAGIGISATDERLIATAFRNTSRAILIADDNRRYIHANSAACRLLKTPPDGLLGKRIDDFAPPDIQPHLAANWTDFLRLGTTTGPFTVIRTDGTAIEVQSTALAHFIPGFHLSILEPIHADRQSTATDARLQALQATGLLDSPADESYDRITRLVAERLDVPTALVSLVDHDRQFFKSQVGLSEPSATLRQTPLSHSFCKHAVALDAPVIVTDATTDPRFHANPAIEDDDVIAYLGVPIRTHEGHVLGSLCAIDHEPRQWTTAHVQLLEQLSSYLSDQIRTPTREPG